MSAFPEEPFGTADPIDLPPLPLAVIRWTGLRIADLGSVFDPAYAALRQAFADGALTPAGPAVAVYRGDPMGEFDLEVGYPVAEPLPDVITIDGQEIVGSDLPSGPSLASSLVGPYDGLGEAWGRLYAAAGSLGHEPAGIWIEVYTSDPRSTPADQLRTDLILPVLR